MSTQTLITFRPAPEPGARYLTGRVTFDEQFRDGRLCTRYWSSSGQVWPEMHIENVRHAPNQPADTFLLSINGQTLAGGYEWVSAEVSPDPSTWRGENRPVSHGVITLLHRVAQVEVKVHTRLDGGTFLIRWLEITNRSDHAVGITALAPFSGLLWAHRVNEHVAPPDDLPFEVAYAHEFDWGQEGDFWFEALPGGVKTVDGRKYGRSGWGRPAFWARNRCNGQTFVCELAWGGNYAFALDCRIHEVNTGRMVPALRAAELYFSMGLSGHDPVLRVLAPGETIATPAVHLGLFQEDSDAIVQATHAHVRQVVMPARVPGRYVEIEANHRGYWCDRENEPGLKQDAEVAKAIGTELYVIDAGWYGNDPNTWWNNTGDWTAGSWLPNGLEPVAKHAHKLGMKFGLWVEAEAAGENSTLRKTHPDWLLTRDGKPIAKGRALDLTNPEVAAWIESELVRIIKQYQLDMYRIDHNHSLTPSGNRRIAGMTEDLTWRYYDALYAIFDHLHARFPGLVFQNCAGGGGRLDWGTLQHFNNTELSDWMRMPRGLKILNGVTMSLPPEILLRTFGTEVSEIDLDGDVDTQLRLVCLCRPIFRGIAPSVAELSGFLLERIAHHLDLYRDIIRPVMIDGRVYHHTPFIRHTELTPWCVLEYASQDGSQSVAGIFRTSNAERSYCLKLRGIQPGRTYDVTLDNSNQTVRISGWELQQRGICVSLELPQSSELVLLKAID
jgi:alpha-galactosidase